MEPAEESKVAWFVRRGSLWAELTATPGWADFAAEIDKARTSTINSLIQGTPNKYGERGDDEKRAMIHVFNIVLKLPLDVQRDAEDAIRITRQYEATRRT